jgi:preprotein translocase subunit YajC
MESIRPANVVINGLQGYVSEVQTRTVNITMNFRSTKNINVTKRQQINIK